MNMTAQYLRDVYGKLGQGELGPIRSAFAPDVVYCQVRPPQSVSGVNEVVLILSMWPACGGGLSLDDMTIMPLDTRIREFSGAVQCFRVSFVGSNSLDALPVGHTIWVNAAGQIIRVESRTGAVTSE